MQTALYLDNPVQLGKALTASTKKVAWIFTGSYGCCAATWSQPSLANFAAGLKALGLRLHYLSPKIHEADFSRERDKVLWLHTQNIPVSVNDWGLLYALKKALGVLSNIYLGRLLTKSIADWYWQELFLEAETTNTKAYLLQNNFKHNPKMKLFREWGISGLEVNAVTANEHSFQAISTAGFEVIGYADSRIMAVSRSCPLRRIKQQAPSATTKINCDQAFCIEPVAAHALSLRELELHRNVIVERIEPEYNWHGYTKLVFTGHTSFTRSEETIE